MGPYNFDVFSSFFSNKINQGGNIERRDVGDSAVVSSKLSDMQNAIESLTHTVNNVATKQQVSPAGLGEQFILTSIFRIKISEI